ncbi:hypothetical protein [Knoellia sp. p5-6-4]|uniref:hypothetical protein n=1 Tax=unclassified Knoellia TaxID=2618719 RepID=UPI0023DA5E42|nr:hypothetical protein [Knoellia sp. p5-6-4]MDF2146028.1 hypothetical protein [Knoellia sp. p5-6-4]
MRRGRAVAVAVTAAAAVATVTGCGGSAPTPATTAPPTTTGSTGAGTAWHEVRLDGARAVGPLVPDGGRGVLVPADRAGATGCLAFVWGGQFRGCLEDSATQPHPIGRPMVSASGNVLTAETDSPTPRMWVGGDWGDGGSAMLGATEHALVTHGGASDDDLALFGSAVTAACPDGALAVWMPDLSGWRVRGGEAACVAEDSRADVVGSVRDGAVLVSGPDVRGRPQAWLVSTDSDSWDDATWQRVPLPKVLDRVTDVDYTYTSTLAGTGGERAVVVLDGAKPAWVADERVDLRHPTVLIADDGFVDDPVVALQGPAGPRLCLLRASWTCVDGPRGQLTGAEVSESLVYLTVRDDHTRVWQADAADLFDH